MVRSRLRVLRRQILLLPFSRSLKHHLYCLKLHLLQAQMHKHNRSNYCLF